MSKCKRPALVQKNCFVTLLKKQNPQTKKTSGDWSKREKEQKSMSYYQEEEVNSSKMSERALTP